MLFIFIETEFSDWSSWSDCVGLPCHMGKQQRFRTCLKQSLCNNEQRQEQNCFVPCSNKNLSTSTSSRIVSKSEGIYSNWTNWSACHSPDCTSIRTRHCLQEPCLDYLIESRTCQENFCSSKKFLSVIIFYRFFSFVDINSTGTFVSSSALNVIVYSTAGIGALIFLLLAILFVFICCRRRQHITTKKGTNKNDYLTIRSDICLLQFLYESLD